MQFTPVPVVSPSACYANSRFVVCFSMKIYFLMPVSTGIYKPAMPLGLEPSQGEALILHEP